MAPSYELYEPATDSADCQRLLPLNAVKNTLKFYRVMTFDAYVDLASRPGIKPGDILVGRFHLSPFDLDIRGQLRTRLALPLSIIDPIFAEETLPAETVLDGAGKLMTGLDGTFLPTPHAAELARRLDLTIIPISNPKDVQDGAATFGSARVETRHPPSARTCRDRLRA